MKTGNLNGQGIAELQNYKFQNLQTAPTTNLSSGRFYFSTTDDTLYIRTSTGWLNALSQGRIYTFDTDSFTNTDDTITLNIATSSTLGGVKVNGNHLTINSSTGILSVDEASTSQKGVIEIATDSEVSTGTSEVLAVNPKQLATKVSKLTTSPTTGTYTKVTINSDGLVTTGANLQASDIPDISSSYVATSLLGANSGVATLGSDGKVPSSQLPGFVDDVIDSYIVSGSTPLSAGWLSDTSGGSALTPETGKIYVVLTSGDYQNKTYRWSGTTYVEISASPGAASESSAGIIEIATQTEVNTGTDDTRAVTPLKLATYVSGMVKSYSTQNPALTESGGLCSWVVTHNLNKSAVSIHVYEVSTGDEVMYDRSITNANSVTIKILSSSDIVADTYMVVVQG